MRSEHTERVYCNTVTDLFPSSSPKTVVAYLAPFPSLVQPSNLVQSVDEAEEWSIIVVVFHHI